MVAAHMVLAPSLFKFKLVEKLGHDPLSRQLVNGTRPNLVGLRLAAAGPFYNV